MEEHDWSEADRALKLTLSSEVHRALREAACQHGLSLADFAVMKLTEAAFPDNEEFEWLDEPAEQEPKPKVLRVNAGTKVERVADLLATRPDHTWTRQEVAAALPEWPEKIALAALSNAAATGHITRVGQGFYRAGLGPGRVRRESLASRVRSFFASNPSTDFTSSDVIRHLSVPRDEHANLSHVLWTLAKEGILVRWARGRYQYNGVPAKLARREGEKEPAPPSEPPSAPPSAPAGPSLTDRVLDILASDPGRGWTLHDIESELGEKVSSLRFILERLAGRNRIEVTGKGEFCHKPNVSPPPPLPTLLPTTLGGNL